MKVFGAYGLKLEIRVVLMSTSRFLRTEGRVHSLTFDHCLTVIFSKATGSTVTKFHIDLGLMEERSVQSVQVT